MYVLVLLTFVLCLDTVHSTFRSEIKDHAGVTRLNDALLRNLA